MLWLGIGATIGANIAYGAGYGLLGALISAWPAVAFIGAVEIAMQQVRRSRGPRAVTSAPAAPEVPGDVEQAVRAAYVASVAAGQPLSQRAMADRFGLSRRKVGQIITSVTVESTCDADGLAVVQVREARALAESGDKKDSYSERSVTFPCRTVAGKQ